MIIVCLVVWALLLGTIGAIFAVPLTACMKIVVHNFKHPYAKVGIDDMMMIYRLWMLG